MANVDPYNVNERVSIATNEFDNIYKTYRKNRNAHKSLDFSNVNMPESTGSSRVDFRKFHQTRIFVQGFGGMQSHGATTGGTFMITGNLPDSITYNLESNWSAPLDMFNSDWVNLATQFVAPKIGLGSDLPSGNNVATTIFVWKGGKPLELQLTIPVIDDGVTDSHTNLVEALEFLGSLVLPGQASRLGYLTPPPSPSGFSFRYGKDKDSQLTFANVSPGKITFQIGGILLLDNMIVKSVKVEYPETKALIRHNYRGFGTAVGTGTGQEYLTPLLAKVTMTIQTVEAITKEVYSRMLWLKPVGSAIVKAADFPATVDAAYNAGATAVNGIVNMVSGDKGNKK